MPSVSRSCASTSLRSACGSLPGSGAGRPTIAKGWVQTCMGSRLMMPARVDAGDARARARGAGRRTSRTCGVTRFMSCGVLSKYLVPPSRMSAVSRRSRVEARQVALLAQEAAHHEAGAHEQHHRQRDLGDEERAASPLPRPPLAAAPAFLQDLVQVDARGPQRGQQAEDEARDDGDREREAQHARVDADVAQELREAGGHDEGEEPRAPEGEDAGRRRTRRGRAAGSR